MYFLVESLLSLYRSLLFSLICVVATGDRDQISTTEIYEINSSGRHLEFQNV